MKSKVTIVLAVFVFGLLAPSAWARGRGGFGGSHRGHAIVGHFNGRMGHVGGGFHRGHSGQGLHFGAGTPAFRSRSAGRFRHFPHGSFRVPPQRFGPVVPFGHRQPFVPRPFIGSHRHLTPRVFVLPPFGSASRSCCVSNSFGVTDPFVSGVVNRRFPFFCAVHGFGFTDQAQFFGHLNFAHHVPLASAASFCTSVQGGGLIFSGF